MLLRRTILLVLLATLLGAAPLPTPQEQCQGLVDLVLPLTTKLLMEHGEFYPFDATLKPDGRAAASMKTITYPKGDHSPSHPTILELRGSLHSEAVKHSIVACAVVYDLPVIRPGTSVKTDAIAIELDHWDNYSLVVFFPYQRQADRIELQEPFAKKGEGRIFAGGGN
jgi:hypothetical protein